MSTLKVDNLQTTGGDPLNSNRVWATWKGTGTVTLHNSSNVSSISDDGAGLYTVNFSNSVSTGNYATAMNIGKGAGQDLNVAVHYRSEAVGTAKQTSKTRVCSAVKSVYTAYDQELLDFILTL